jgi:hypothetical protein
MPSIPWQKSTTALKPTSPILTSLFTSPESLAPGVKFTESYSDEVYRMEKKSEINDINEAVDNYD